MREKKYHIYLTDDEQSRVIQSLINLKNNLIAQGRYTDAVDDAITWNADDQCTCQCRCSYYTCPGGLSSCKGSRTADTDDRKGAKTAEQTTENWRYIDHNGG